MLTQLQPGQKIYQRFGVISIAEKTTTKGDPYLLIELTHPSGSIIGKVWSDAIPSVNIKAGSVAELEAVVDQYRGNNNFNILNARHIPEDNFQNYVIEKPTIVFDIETVGYPFEDLDKNDQDYFVNRLEKDFDGTKEQLHNRTGLYPIFGFVVAIGMYNPGTKHGAVYYLDYQKNNDATKQKTDNRKQKTEKKLDNTNTTNNHEAQNKQFVYKKFEDEKKLLEEFWQTASKYERFITYNGSGFDFPFLVFRSAVHRVKVPFETFGSHDKFIDLSLKLRVNNRPFRLEQLCKAFGISNPKEDGVSGMEVANLYRAGKIGEILKYVSRDVLATAELYTLWKTYLAGKIII